MKRTIRLIQSVLLVSLLLTACNLPSTQTPEPEDPMSVVNTAAAQTVIAMTTQLASGQTPDAPTVIVVGQPTATTQPSQTSAAPTQNSGPAITMAPQQQNTSIPATAVPCDRAQFVADVTVPDDAQYGPGAGFVKTWRLRNVGSCTWTTSYKLVFDTGDAMGGPASVNLPSSVAPNQEIDLSVNLKAPDTAKTYQGFWMLMNANGQKFGLGAGDKAFWVKIVVGATNAPFAVTSVRGSADSSNYSGACPHTFKFTFDIVTSASGEVTYYIAQSDGTKSSTKKIEFDKAGTKTVTYEWANFNPPSDPYDGWVQIYIDNPNHQWFSKVNFRADCE